MARVIANMVASVDGFIAGPDDRCDELFGWYGAGRGAPALQGRASLTVVP
jgi:hypothetical protein